VKIGIVCSVVVEWYNVCVWCKQIKGSDVQATSCKSTKEKSSNFYHVMKCVKLFVENF